MEAKQPTEQDKKKDTGVIIGIGVGGGGGCGGVDYHWGFGRPGGQEEETLEKFKSDTPPNRFEPTRKHWSVSPSNDPQPHAPPFDEPAARNAPPLSRRSNNRATSRHVLSVRSPE